VNKNFEAIRSYKHELSMLRDFFLKIEFKEFFRFFDEKENFSLKVFFEKRGNGKIIIEL